MTIIVKPWHEILAQRYFLLLILAISLSPAIAISSPAISSLVWTQASSPDTTGTYYGLALFDLDEDGRLDIVATKYNQGLEIWLNTTGGWIQEKTNLPEKGFYTQVAVCDLNGDKKGVTPLAPAILAARDGGGIELWLGKDKGLWELSMAGLPDRGRYFDVKVLNSGSQKKILAALDKGIRVWDCNDRGEWIAAGEGLPVYEYYHAVEAVDINLDGNLDLIAGNSNNGGVKAWLGNSKGHWQYAASGLPTTGSYYGLTASDINLDGKPDIIAASNSNQGLAVFSEISVKWTTTGTGLPFTGNYYSVICEDFNLDGNPDIAAANNDNEGLSVWLGNGKGNFLLASVGLPTKGYYHSIAIGDINQDKYPDIVTASSDGLRVYCGGPGNVAFLGWSGKMGYATDGIQPEYGTLATLFTYQVNYINTKNLAPQKGYPMLKIYDNHPLSGSHGMTPVNNEDNAYTDGRLYSYTTTLPLSEHGYSYQIEAIDTEGNIAIGTPVHPQQGPRVTMEDIDRQDWMQISTPETSREHYSMQLGDINMDGKLDVVAASSSGIKVWMAGDGGVWLPASHGLPTADFYYGISLVDFNLDGLMDIVATKLKGVEAWLGDGQGRWTKASYGLPEEGFFYGVVACDVNMDGFPDIIAGTNDQKGLRVWLGNGKWKWRLSSEGLPTDERLCSVAVCDLNNDGIPDIVAGDYNGIRAWLQMSPKKMEYVGKLPVSTRFDLAGQPDILFGRYDGIIMGWTGDGTGKWVHSFTDLGGVE
ncbi:MAG: VCBS repeat-containing protein [Candidatus Desantisbacteria bacterium]